jgi:hypothetical protein
VQIQSWQLTDCAAGGSHKIPWDLFQPITSDYLDMRDVNLPQLYGIRELIGLTWRKPEARTDQDKSALLFWRIWGLAKWGILNRDVRDCSPSLLSTSKMLSFSWRKCQEANDRVYAVRQMLELPEMMDLVPDYSLPAERLYSIVTAHLLRKSSTLKIHKWSSRDLVLYSEHNPTRRRSQYPLQGTEHPSILLTLAELSRDPLDLGIWPLWVPDYNRLDRVMRGPLQQYDPALC